MCRECLESGDFETLLAPHSHLGLRFRYIFRGAFVPLSCDRSQQNGSDASQIGSIPCVWRKCAMSQTASSCIKHLRIYHHQDFIASILLRPSLFEESGVVRYHRTIEASLFQSSMVGGIKAARYSRAHVLPPTYKCVVR